jgi:hypothetical protein
MSKLLRYIATGWLFASQSGSAGQSIEQQTLINAKQLDDTSAVKAAQADLSTETNLSVKTEPATKSGSDFSTALVVKSSVLTGVTNVVEWIDGLFYDENYEREDVDVLLDVRQFFITEESLTTEYRTRVRTRVRLPNATKRINLFLDSSEDPDEQIESDNILDSVEQTSDNPTLGLQYFSKQSERFDQRLNIGYRFGRSQYYLGARVRAFSELSNNWQIRFSERLRHYEHDGVEQVAILDFNYDITEDRVFRQRLQWNWEEIERNRIGHQAWLSSSWFFNVDDQSAGRVAWISQYNTEPTPRWVSSRIQFSYRERLGYDWIFYEITPYVTWEEQNNWRDNYGIQLVFNYILQQ